ncbi:unnamed protein product [marine sediment metagenome]|uniref:Uncharacterized protein n=1 Tax=marine sediment metagenome TaxID=412755 RepID=X1IYG5_9ZZZZ
MYKQSNFEIEIAKVFQELTIREWKEKMTKAVNIFERVFLSVVRYIIETGVIQWLDEPKRVKDDFDKMAKGLSVSGFNFYIKNFVEIQNVELEGQKYDIYKSRERLDW